VQRIIAPENFDNGIELLLSHEFRGFKARALAPAGEKQIPARSKYRKLRFDPGAEI
jgi:hypothetical protein